MLWGLSEVYSAVGTGSSTERFELLHPDTRITAADKKNESVYLSERIKFMPPK